MVYARRGARQAIYNKFILPKGRILMRKLLDKWITIHYNTAN